MQIQRSIQESIKEQTNDMLFDLLISKKSTVVGSILLVMMMGLLAFRGKFIGKENRKLKREIKGKMHVVLCSVRKRLVQREESNTFHRIQLQNFHHPAVSVFHFRWCLFLLVLLTLAQNSEASQMHDPFVSLIRNSFLFYY